MRAMLNGWLNGFLIGRPAAMAMATALAAAPVLAQAVDPARTTVETLDSGLVASMKAGTAAGMAGRSRILAPVVDRTFDLPLMTRLVVGADWATMSPADRTALVDAFRRMTIANYASNFDGWSGESFVVDPRIDQRGSDRLVRTQLKQSRGAPVPISYRLRQSADGSWRIIDVFYNNAISQLATRRADFAAVLKKGGAKALVTHLNTLSAKVGG
jgi:phospholipid transport system substrate-binding protein